MTIKSFFKLLISLILSLSLMAMSVLVAYVSTNGGSFLGYEFTSAEEQAYVNALLLGLDQSGTRADVIILAQLNLADGELNMLQIPRDTYMKNNGRRDKKINSSYGAGKEEAVFREVEMLLNIHVDKYILIDTKGFRAVIDTIGGVEFNVPINMNYDDPVQDLHIHLSAGPQTLNGAEAEQFVRFRQNNDGSGYALGDVDRLKAQSEFIQATVDEVFQLKNVTKINDLVEDFSRLVKSNFSLTEMLTYAPYVFATERDKICTYQLAGDGEYIGGVSYFIANKKENQKIIDEHFTPSAATLKKSELEIKHSVVGLGSKRVSAGNKKPSKSVFNKFTSVDIIDASGGTADLTTLNTKLKEYGFNVLNISDAGSTVYPETVVVSKGRNNRAASIARMVGLNNYMHNAKKESGSDITIILGKGYTN